MHHIRRDIIPFKYPCAIRHCHFCRIRQDRMNNVAVLIFRVIFRKRLYHLLWQIFPFCHTFKFIECIIDFIRICRPLLDRFHSDFCICVNFEVQICDHRAFIFEHRFISLTCRQFVSDTRKADALFCQRLILGNLKFAGIRSNKSHI